MLGVKRAELVQPFFIS